MNCVVVFGSNSFELTKTTIAYVKEKNAAAEIILVLNSKMLVGFKETIKQVDAVITTDIGYTESIINDIEKTEKLNNIDGVLFYTQMDNDLGNINILEIVNKICNGASVYGLNRECEVFSYENIKFYIKGLKLYQDINLFINESMNLK